MHTITVEKECGCFRRSSLENNITFTSKDAALMEATRMATQMNDEFCGKHQFQAVEEGENMIIKPLMAQSSGGCCGGGCHS